MLDLLSFFTPNPCCSHRCHKQATLGGHTGTASCAAKFTFVNTHGDRTHGLPYRAIAPHDKGPSARWTLHSPKALRDPGTHLFVALMLNIVILSAPNYHVTSMFKSKHMTNGAHRTAATPPSRCRDSATVV